MVAQGTLASAAHAAAVASAVHMAEASVVAAALAVVVAEAEASVVAVAVAVASAAEDNIQITQNNQIKQRYEKTIFSGSTHGHNVLGCTRNLREC
jgi:hypothetical protein